MQKVFSSVEVSETVLVHDALVHHGIEASIQNQHSGYSATPAFRPPAEVWIRNDSDLETARGVVRATILKLDSTSDDAPWVCPQCNEQNPLSFELCWSCERGRHGAA
jgi:hypothetical protein